MPPKYILECEGKASLLDDRHLKEYYSPNSGALLPLYTSAAQPAPARKLNVKQLNATVKQVGKRKILILAYG